MITDAQLRPAPNPATATTSPFLILPERTASANASGIEPALVLPYSSTFRITFDIGIPMTSDACSMIRILA